MCNVTMLTKYPPHREDSNTNSPPFSKICPRYAMGAYETSNHTNLASLLLAD